MNPQCDQQRSVYNRAEHSAEPTTTHECQPTGRLPRFDRSNLDHVHLSPSTSFATPIRGFANRRPRGIAPTPSSRNLSLDPLIVNKIRGNVGVDQ